MLENRVGEIRVGKHINRNFHIIILTLCSNFLLCLVRTLFVMGLFRRKNEGGLKVQSVREKWIEHRKLKGPTVDPSSSQQRFPYYESALMMWMHLMETSCNGGVNPIIFECRRHVSLWSFLYLSSKMWYCFGNDITNVLMDFSVGKQELFSFQLNASIFPKPFHLKRTFHAM